MTVRIYLSGPMTGLPEFNHPAFMDAEARLAEAGFLCPGGLKTGPPHDG